MSWNCRCELCRNAFLGKIETRRWLDFLRHRDGAVLELVSDRGFRAYLAEVDGDVLVTTEKTDGYKTLEETWHEEIRLNHFIAGCRVEIYENGGTPFDEILRKRVSA